MSETTEMNVTIARPDQAAMTRSAEGLLAMAVGFDVVDATTCELAAEELKEIKRRASALDEERKKITKPLDEAKKAVMDLFRGPLDVLARAESALKGKILTFQQEERRKAEEARIAAEKAAREERERLEREAEELRKQGKSGEAEVKRQIAEMVVSAPAPVQEPPKVAGIATKKIVDFEVEDLHALIRHVAEHPELLSLLTVDSTKLRAYVRGLGMACKLPGVRVCEKESLAASRR